MLRNQKGFTLMELMVVIVIIGVLAAIGVPAYSGYVERANKAVCQSNRRSLETAVQLYLMDHPEVTDKTSITLKSADVGEYITNLDELKCPKGGGYEVNESGKVVCDYKKNGVAYHND